VNPRNRLLVPAVPLRQTGCVSYPGSDHQSFEPAEPAEPGGPDETVKLDLNAQAGQAGQGQIGQVGSSPGASDGPVRVRIERLEEFGGDEACWLNRVCPECGRITEGRDANRCASCGGPLPSD
jgi:hypothetical protein